MVTRRLLWSADAWDPDAAPAAEGALVVDSFLAAEGRIVDAAAHRARFASSCHNIGLTIPAERLDRFWDTALKTLPAAGAWFPRLEAHRADPPRLVCWIRTAPPLTDCVRLWVPPVPDPRQHPRTKGPDLAVLAALRRDAGVHGADDAVLVDTYGELRETAHSALLWWRGPVLCHPPADVPVLPSITAQRVLAQARSEGIPVRPDRAHWTEIAGLETWAVNALHGIRPVTAWRDADRAITAPPADVTRLARFRALAVPRPSSILQ